jgi:hypothetical protein
MSPLLKNGEDSNRSRFCNSYFVFSQNITWRTNFRKSVIPRVTHSCCRQKSLNEVILELDSGGFSVKIRELLMLDIILFSLSSQNDYWNIALTTLQPPSTCLSTHHSRWSSQLYNIYGWTVTLSKLYLSFYAYLHYMHISQL